MFTCSFHQTVLCVVKSLTAGSLFGWEDAVPGSAEQRLNLIEESGWESQEFTRAIKPRDKAPCFPSLGITWWVERAVLTAISFLHPAPVPPRSPADA